MNDENMAEHYQLAESLIAEQNFGAGIAASVVAALAGALGWGVVAAAAGAVYSWLAIALGALVGYGMQVFGRGLSTKYSVIAAALAIIGCLAGYVAAGIILDLKGSGTPLGVILASLSIDDILDYFARTIRIVDALFLLLAGVTAWYFAQRGLTRDQRFAVRKYAERSDPSQGMIQ